MIVIEEFSAKLKIKLTLEFVYSGEDGLTLFAQILIVVKTDFFILKFCC